MLFADHNGTTPIAEQVFAAMAPYLREHWGNPSSRLTRPGRESHQAIEASRAQLAQLLDCSPENIVFTSGGTESCFLGIAGSFVGNPERDHLLISAVEHEAVRQVAAAMARLNPRIVVETVPVLKSGALNVEELLRRLRPGRSVVSLMLANNETGVIFPISELSQHLRERDVIFHTDAVQAIGKLPVDFQSLGVDLLTGSAHKFFGPKGVGFLVLRSRFDAWQTPILGGGQENGRRGGTENVAGIVGLGMAAQLAKRTLSHSGSLPTNERLELLLQQRLAGIVVNGKASARLPNTTSLTIEGILGQELVAELANREIYISAGSACSGQVSRPSQVLLAMGLDTLRAASTVRISLGPEADNAELEKLVDGIAESIQKIRVGYSEHLDGRLSSQSR